MERKHQHYALDESDNLVHVSKVDKNEGHTYRCPNPECGQEMIVRQGSIREWHFAHKKKECEYDKYLHTLAIIRISEWFNSQEHITMIKGYPTVCANSKTCKWLQKDKCNGWREMEIDLKKWYKSCEIEKQFKKDNHTFVADIFCPYKNKKGENLPLFIEIYVTHKCEKEKLDSGIRIIEVKIECEEDIDNFINNPIKCTKNVSYHNFKYDDITTNDLKRPIQKFILYVSGKSFLDYDNFSCKDYDIRRGVFEVSIVRDLLFEPEYRDLDLRTIGQALAYRENNHLRFCCLCKWRGYSFMENKDICKLYKKCGTKRYCFENDTYQCDYYQFSAKSFEYHISSVKPLIDTGAIDIWISAEWNP